MINKWLDRMSWETFWALGAGLFLVVAVFGSWFVLRVLERGGEAAAWVLAGTSVIIIGALVTLVRKLDKL